MVGVVAAVLTLAPVAWAQTAAVPVAPVSLPAQVDWQPEYQGQILCSDWAKPGAVKLSKLLRRTYGTYITYISRSCATPGISEHEEGRAVDWMVDSEDPVARRKAHEFLAWVTANDGAMARRLGIMYLIYEDKMWRAYRPEDGWPQYQGCFSRQSEGDDTSCHRDHIHISLTWDGAYAETSFWTGRAETRPPCDSSSKSRPNGTRTQPRSLINTDTGIGVAGKQCRLSAGTSYSGRSYQIKVPVPTLPGGARPVQHAQLARFTLDAPVGMTIRSATTQTIPQGAKPGTPIDIPLARDGIITFSLGAGYAAVWLRGTGVDANPTSTQPAPPPTTGTGKPRVTLPPFPAKSRVNSPILVAGDVRNAPAGSTLTLRRRLGKGAFATVATAPVVSARYRLSTPATTTSGRYQYQAVLSRSGRAVDTSAMRGIVVAPAAISLAQPRGAAKAGSKVRLAGLLVGAPAGAVVAVQDKVGAGKYTNVQFRKVVNGSYKTRKRVKTVGRHVFRVVLASPSPLRLWAISPERAVVVRR